ncbi:GNAT family N-acetyltransferase [Nocardioides sp. MJB4]|uniref:GNAT family N-acetyltransferase n=2 Tax=Nocardioides donggukensis TaxID=2774019 RepID=A0A927PZ12_9ACTN|nr:GNAT family N-acetyltransferase [Nocardioides donggukensis]
MPPMTPTEAAGWLRHGWDGEPPLGFLGYADGTPVGYAEYSTSTWDNLHLAWLWIGVHPDRRRRGHGTELLCAMEERARSEGRTSIGVDGWDTAPCEPFAAAHGLVRRSAEVVRRQVMAEVDWARVESLHAEAAAAAADYELVRRTGATPDEDLAALAEITAAINDAPTDDLDIEDEVFPPARVRDYETAMIGQGRVLHRVLARHRGTGAPAGHTVVVVEGERPHLGEQHDTAVARDHRGHRLGLLLKTEMLLWLREVEPRLEQFDTWNAESNAHMVAVNELLGYRVVGRMLDFQRDVRDAIRRDPDRPL